MIKEKVVIAELDEVEPGQVRYFQVKIPRDARRIIGIESTVSQLAALGGAGTGTIGTTGNNGGGGTGLVGNGGSGGLGTGGNGGLDTGGNGGGTGVLGTGGNGGGGGGIGLMGNGGAGNGNLPTQFNPTWMFIKPNPLMGEFRLQSCGKANIFYANNIYKDDANVGQGDYTLLNDFAPSDYTHEVKAEEDEVNEDGKATLIKGIYRDRQAAGVQNYNYTVKIYVWYETISKTL